MGKKCKFQYGKNYIIRVTIYCYCIRPCWIQLDYATAQTKVLYSMIFSLHLYKRVFTKFQPEVFS